MNNTVVLGDIVTRRENGKKSQRGYCKELRQYANVQIVGTNRVIERVPSKRLYTVTPYGDDAAVCLGKKYGRLQDFDQKITMQSKCGSTVEILSTINDDLEDYWVAKRGHGYFDHFYTGQEVTCIPNNLELPHWVIISKAMKRSMQRRQRFTVQNVEPTNIEVLWYDDKSSDSPYIKAEDVKKLHTILSMDYINLKSGERRLLRISSSDLVIKRHNWIHKQSFLHQPGLNKWTHFVNTSAKKKGEPQLDNSFRLPTSEPEKDWSTEESETEDISDNDRISSTKSGRNFPPKLGELIQGHIVAVEVLNSDSKATVIWQDGTEEKDIPTVQLYDATFLNDHVFFPGEWVVHEGADKGSFGVIQQVSHLEQTAIVKWFKSADDIQKPPVFNAVLENSVYDLSRRSKYPFRPGLPVRRIPIQENKLGRIIHTSREGYVVVVWIDGTKENCWPQNIELIPDSIDLEDPLDDNIAQVLWETESIESASEDLVDETLQNAAVRLDFVRSRIIYLKNVVEQHHSYGTFSVLKELLTMYDNSSYLDKLLDTSFFSSKSRHFQFLLTYIKDKAKIFSSIDLSTSSHLLTKKAENENINKVMKLVHEVNVQLDQNKKEESSKDSEGPSVSELSSPVHENICVELLSMMKVRMDLAYAEIISRIGGPPALTVMTKASDTRTVTLTSLSSVPTIVRDETMMSLTSSELNQSDTFDSEMYCLLEDAPTNHHFFSKKHEPTDMKRFFMAVKKEHKLFKEALPPGVWVRTYTDRMDLLSVMIKGPNTTPYEDGLFLFDVQLSQDYPRTPPLCHYISYISERINPNLYVEGKVCVSLLGTWMGHGTEKWCTNSTLLQLIVSIQGLILVCEPYYNEPTCVGPDESKQEHENSRTYNELVILKLVESMTKLVCAPPKIFKNEIYSHFRHHGKEMCERLQKWCSNSDPLEPEFPLRPISKGLELSLNTALKIFKASLDNKLNTSETK